MTDKTGERRQLPLMNADETAIWANELFSIEVQGPVTVLTFAELRREGQADARRTVCARLAVPSRLLPSLVERIRNLESQAAAMSQPAGSA